MRVTGPGTAPSSAVAGAAAVRVEDVSKRLAGQPVLDHVSFACPAGEITALLGPNGAGKSTTVSLVTGVRRPDAGAVWVASRPVGSAAARREVAVVPQEIGFPATIGVEVALGLVAGQRRPGPCSGDPDDLLRRLGLSALRSRRVGGLSGGQRRRLAIAMAMLAAPPILVFDEATTGLDEHFRAQTWLLLRDYVRRGGCVLVTSHVLADIEQHADRVVALAAGRVAAHGILAEVRERLGGSVVDVAAPVHQVTRLRRLTAECGEAVPAPAGRMRWHTREPLRLAGQLAAGGVPVHDVTVGPIPLADTLMTLQAEHDAAEAADVTESGAGSAGDENTARVTR